MEPTTEITPVKLTKTAVAGFLHWTSSRYNSYLDYGNKAENVKRVFLALQAGYYTGWNGDKPDPSKTVFTVECASPVGESGPQGNKHHGTYWRTKQAGDNYIVDCVNKTITGQYSKRIIKFL